MDELEKLIASDKTDFEIPAHLQFDIVMHSNSIDKCSREQLIALAKLALKSLIVERHTTKELLKHKWFTDDSDYNVAA